MPVSISSSTIPAKDSATIAKSSWFHLTIHIADISQHTLVRLHWAKFTRRHNWYKLTSNNKIAFQSNADHLIANVKSFLGLQIAAT